MAKEDENRMVMLDLTSRTKARVSGDAPAGAWPTFTVTLGYHVETDDLDVVDRLAVVEQERLVDFALGGER